ncbi:MAG: hypothetical protein WC685_13510 [Methylobacter sp.]|jgi:hypothetical protein
MAILQYYQRDNIAQNIKLNPFSKIIELPFQFLTYLGTRESSMKNKYTLSILSFCLCATITGCTTTPEKTEDAQAFVSDYPTRDRVEYVLNCVGQHGGLTFITQYACGCKIDKIAEKLSFNEYEAAKTFTYLSKGQTGDAGAVFRDPTQSKDLRKKLKEAEEYAEKSCFVK